MQVLQVVSEKTGNVLGTITADNGTVETTLLGTDVLDQARRTLGADDTATFAALAAGGWSNGYATVRAQP